MDLPFFKAFPTDWEIAMIKAGIPAAKRGDLYRLIFFAWQQGGLNLAEDEQYAQRMRVLAQAFGIKPCHFKPLIDLYRTLSVETDGVWLPEFLIRQFVNATNFQNEKRSKHFRVENELETSCERVENELETSCERVENELETSCERVENELETKIALNSFSINTPLASASASASARAETEGEHARARAEPGPTPEPVSEMARVVPEWGGKSQLPATPEAGALDDLVEYLIAKTGIPCLGHEKAYHAAARAILNLTRPEVVRKAVDHFFSEKPGTKLNFLAQDYSAWLKARTQRQRQREASYV